MTTNAVLKLDLEEIESDELPLKLSALTHAVRASRVQSKRTLGPAEDGVPIKELDSGKTEKKEIKNNTLIESSGDAKNIESSKIPMINKPFDFEIYDQYALLKLADRQRRSLVRKELVDKRRHLLCQQNAKSQQAALHKQTELSPNEIKSKIEQLIIEEAENVASQMTAENEQRLREQNEDHRWFIEQIQLQQALRQHYALRKAIIDCQIRFGEKYEEFSKEVRSSKPSERIEKLKQSIIAVLMKYNGLNDKLKKAVNEVDSTDLQLAEQLSSDLDMLRKQFEAEVIAEAAVAAAAVVDTHATSTTPSSVVDGPVVQDQQQQQQLQQSQQLQQQQSQQQHSNQAELQQQQQPPPLYQPPAKVSSGYDKFISSENLAYYNNIMAYYSQKVESVKPLQADESMKKYRSNCQKAINIPVNTISAVSADHLQDKYDKLYGLISGAKVNTTDGLISAMDHPLGRDFCLLVLAKKFVSQGDSTVSSNPQAAFPIAAIIVAIWQKVPEFGQLFLAYTFKESPYLVPYFMPQLEGQSTEDYFKALGYRFSGGALEQQDMYLKRQSGLVKLYSAVMVAKPRALAGAMHPYGIDNGWRWLNNILNLDPLPDICATLILGFLQTVGHEMLQIYRNQFMKLLSALQNQYMPRLSKIDEGGPKARLEVFLIKVIKENMIEKPPGLLAPNFW